MTEINDKEKVQLLFKEFTGVVNAKQLDPFSLENFAFKDYILNNNVLLEDIPATLPSGWRSNQLDGSANIPANSIINLAAIGYPQLSFHKRRDLSSVTFGSFKTWYVDNGSGGSALQNAIPFKQDPGPTNSYNYFVYQKFTLPTSYAPVNMYSDPTYWLFDFKSGFLEFYGEEDNLNGTNLGTGGIDLSVGPATISFFQYVGATGGAGGGGSGGQSVTIEPWPEPFPMAPNTTRDINYVIATVDISGNSEMALGYFTLQLGNPYKQVMGFYAGVIENKGAFIKIISCTNEDTVNRYGFKNLKIISYQGTCYLVSTFGCPLSPAGAPDLLKIILVNNNANLDNPTNNPNWILRALDSDWAPNGPEPPATRMPWTVGPSPGPYVVPALPPALVTVSLLQNDGQPYGVSTQPEYFQNNIVLDTSANILAGENGTGIIDICGGLYVDRDASFNRDVHVRSSVDISGNLNVDGNSQLNDISIAGGKILDISNGWMKVYGRGIDASLLPGGGSNWGEVGGFNPNPPYQDQRGLRIQAQAITFDMSGGALTRGVCFNLADYNGGSEFIIQGSNFTRDFVLVPGGQPGFGGCTADISGTLKVYGEPGYGNNNLYVDGHSNLNGNVVIGGDLGLSGDLTIGGDLGLSGDLTVDGTFINNNTQFVDYATLTITPPDLSENWYDVARIETSSLFSVDTYNAGVALFEIKCYSPDTSSNYTNIRCYATNIIERAVSLQVLNCVTTNAAGTKTITGLRICTPGSNSRPKNDGCLLQIAIKNTTVDMNVQARVYQNNTYLGSIPTFGHQWILDLSGNTNNNPFISFPNPPSPPLIVLFDEYYVADLTYNPNNSAGYTPGTNSGVFVSDLDSLFTGATKHGDLVDMSHNDISGCKDFSVEKIEIKNIANTSQYFEPMLTIDTSSNLPGLIFNATTKDSVLGNGTAITMAPLGGTVGKTYIETDLSGLTIYATNPGFINLQPNGNSYAKSGDGGGLVKISSSGFSDQRSILHMDNTHTGFAIGGKSEIILGPTDISSSEWYCSLRGENWPTNIFGQHSTGLPFDNGGINSTRALGVYIQATGAAPPNRVGTYSTTSPDQAYILSSPPKTGQTSVASNTSYYTTGYTTFGNSVIGDPAANGHMDISGLYIAYGPAYKLCTDEFQVIQLGDRAKPFVRINSGHNAPGSPYTTAGTLSTTYLLANLVAAPTLQGVRQIIGNGGSGSEYGSSNIEIMTGSASRNADIEIGVLNTRRVVIGHPNNSSSHYGIPQIHLGSGAGSNCGYIDCDYATTPNQNATGPTNICADNHNGYIGTYGGTSATGTGLRGYSMVALLKTYMAPNLSPLAGGDFASSIKYTCIEAPQGFTMFRGQVQLDAFSVAIDIDTAVVVGSAGKLFIPHENPFIAGTANPPGTFNAMFQNPMVMVTNAGVWDLNPPPNAYNLMTLLEDPLWTSVRGSLSQMPISGYDISNTQIKISANPSGTPNLVVNYIVYAERRDEGYINNSQVRPYPNPFTKSMKTWGSASDSSGNPFPGK